jgi:preprotein translocase subunit SecG
MSRRLAALAVLFFSIALVAGCGYADAQEKATKKVKSTAKSTARSTTK